MRFGEAVRENFSFKSVIRDDLKLEELVCVNLALGTTEIFDKSTIIHV